MNGQSQQSDLQTEESTHMELILLMGAIFGMHVFQSVYPEYLWCHDVHVYEKAGCSSVPGAVSVDIAVMFEERSTRKWITEC